MFKILKKFFGQKDPPGGVVDRGIDTDEACEQIFNWVSLQLDAVGEVGPPLFMGQRSFILGYIAVLSEQLVERMDRENRGAATMLVTMNVCIKLTGSSEISEIEALHQEFINLHASHDYDYGQGGALAIADSLDIFMEGEVPKGLFKELTSLKRHKE